MKFQNQIDTPVENLDNPRLQTEIKKFAKSIHVKKRSKNSILYKPKLCLLIFLIIFILTVLLVLDFINVSIDYSNEDLGRNANPLWMGLSIFAMLCWGLFTFIVLLIAIGGKIEEISRKKVVMDLRLFITASESLTNISFESCMKGKYSSILRAGIKGPKIPEMATSVPNASYLITGRINNDNYELVNEWWSWTDPNDSQAHMRSTWSLVMRKDVFTKYPIQMHSRSRNTKKNNKIHKKDEMQSMSIDNFNDEFAVYGSGVTTRKLFNAAEIEKYLELNQIMKGVYISIEDDIIRISFNPKQEFLNTGIETYAEIHEIEKEILDDINGSFKILLNLISYYLVLRRISR